MKFYNRNGILWFRIQGKREKSSKLPYTEANKRLLQNRFKNEKFFEKFNVKTDMPYVADLCNEALENKQVKETTYKAYENIHANWIIPFFSKIRINEVKPITIKEWYDTFKDRSTLCTASTILKDAIEIAILNEYITSNPMIVSKQKFKSAKEPEPFSDDEIAILMETEDTQLRDMIGVMIFTGMRIGEMIGLKWSDIDFNEYIISINRTRTHGFEQTPKTRSSKRVIDLLPQVEQFLIKKDLREYVFYKKDGKPYAGSFDLQSRWEKLLDKKGIKKRSMYNLRHTFASQMLMNGEEILWVSKMLGHKSAGTTLAYYSRYIRKKGVRKTTSFDIKPTYTA
jgi:integrase